MSAKPVCSRCGSDNHVERVPGASRHALVYTAKGAARGEDCGPLAEFWCHRCNAWLSSGMTTATAERPVQAPAPAAAPAKSRKKKA